VVQKVKKNFRLLKLRYGYPILLGNIQKAYTLMAHWNFVKVKLSDIEHLDRNELKQSRLDTLLNGYDPFEKVLNSESAPIALDMSRKPYRITDGRHRVYLARQKGYTEVRAVST
jgi:hypothetical protein